MKVKEYDRFFGEKITRELSLSWDNDGLMCCPDPEREVRRVLAVLDITEEAVDEAIRGGYDLILSHHPLVFRGVKSLTARDGVGRKLLKLVQYGISAMSFHTRLDALTGGVNDLLAASLGLTEVTPFGAEQIGRVGNLREETSPEEFARLVKKTLHAPTVLLSSAGKRVSRVAVLGGSGRDDLFAAIAA
jgi:dinuclear metal center YbgI/SA1388 family protein